MFYLEVSGLLSVNSKPRHPQFDQATGHWTTGAGCFVVPRELLQRTEARLYHRISKNACKELRKHTTQIRACVELAMQIVRGVATRNCVLVQDYTASCMHHFPTNLQSAQSRVA